MPHLDPDTLHRYLAKQLPSADRQYADQHLRTCEPCRAALEDERRFGNLLELDAPTAVGGDSLRDDLIVAVRALDRRRDWQRRVGFVVVLALAGVLGFNLGKLVRRPASSAGDSGLKGVAPALAQRAIEHLDELQLIRADPALVRDLPFATALTRALNDRREPDERGPQ